MTIPILESRIYQLRLEPLTWEHFTDLEAACAEGDLGEVPYNSVPYLSELKQYVQQALA